MTPSLRFDPKSRVVEIQDPPGPLSFAELYRAIRKWEGSDEGIVFAGVLEGSGNITLPDGRRTPRVMTFVNGWRLAASVPVSIVDGLVAGRDADGQTIHPVVESARDNVRLLSDDSPLDDSKLAEDTFAPTEAQARDALYRAARFREDWVIDGQARLIRRRSDAPSRAHSVLGLYWFCKEEWLRQPGLSGLRFPIQGDDQAPGVGVIRTWTLTNGWRIADDDLAYLEDGPLSIDGAVVVSPSSDDAEDGSAPSLSPGQATIGVVTALPKEYAAVLAVLNDPVDHQGRGPRHQHFTLGTLQALNGGVHTVALVMSGVGNTQAALRAASLADEFPNLQAVIMVGIAGAVPRPTVPTDHVRLGDVVVSDEHGIIQYDRGKNTPHEFEPLHTPIPPGPRLLDAARRLQAIATTRGLDWSSLLLPTAGVYNSTRPPLSADVLHATDQSGTESIVEHPADPQRQDGVPRVFLGAIGAANQLQKDAATRDALREKFNLKAIEMEGAGIMDASYDYIGLQYLVVRGTCDYCDTHKNDVWQEYAACVAAAYLVALLRQVFAD